MHNGIISNVAPADNTLSTCDSEVLLHRYRDFEVYSSPLNLTEAMRDVHGYYAAMVFNDDGVVDIWRDEQADLVLAHVRGVGTVISTTEDIIYRTAKSAGKKVEFCYPVLAFTHLRWQRGKSPKMLGFEKPAMQYISEKGELTPLDNRPWWQKEEEEEIKKFKSYDNDTARWKGV